MPEAFIISGCRTPMGKFQGALRELSATELGAVVVAEAVRRSGVSPSEVNEVIIGNVLSAGLGQAPARQCALKAGLPASVAALTVNKVCGSGLKAVMLAAQTVRLGDAEVVVAGGTESMSRVPHLLSGARGGWKFGHQPVLDAMIHDGLWCAFENCHMGSEADYIAAKHNILRADQDRFAFESQRRAAAARESGAFAQELVGVSLANSKNPHSGGESPQTLFADDEGPRADTTPEKLAALKPAFGSEGTVTAGNSSMLSDGAAALVVVSESRARSIHTGLRARIVAYATAGVEPKEIFVAPVFAMEKVLAQAGLKVHDIDLFEINEAFAAQMLACMRGLKLDPAQVNVHGGAIALGHPIGASGARVLVTLLYALRQRKLRRGLASLCLGGGNAVAMIVEQE